MMKESSRYLSLLVAVYVPSSVVQNALGIFVFEGFDYAFGFNHGILNHRTHFIRWYLLECKGLDRFDMLRFAGNPCQVVCREPEEGKEC